jgi:low affinity Fe/Cu permease
MQQQNRFNVQVSDFLRLQMTMDDQLREALRRTQQAGIGRERDIAENMREINEIAERLAALLQIVSPEHDEKK